VQTYIARVGSSDSDFVQVVGYNPGAGQWSGNASPVGIGADKENNVYVVTSESDSLGDRHCIRKIGASGTTLRVVNVDYSDAPEDWGDLRVDSNSGAVFVGANYGGTDIYPDSRYRPVVMKFDLTAPEGSEMLWRSFGPEFSASNNGSVVLALGNDGSVTAGATGVYYHSTYSSDYDKYQWSVLRFNAAGSMLWCRNYSQEASNTDLMLTDLALDGDGNALIAGYSTDASYNSAAVYGKVAANGDIQFSTSFANTTFGAYNGSNGQYLQVLPDNSAAAVAAVTGTSTHYCVLKLSNPADVLIPVSIGEGSPADQFLAEGGTLTLSVQNSGSPAGYQWRKNDSNNVPQPIAGATNATLTIGNAETSDSGAYSVVVTNSLNSVTSRTATVVVYAIVPLADALSGSYTWVTGGDGNWVGQTGTSSDGVSSASIGGLAQGQTSWVETTVTGPGTLSFWWNSNCSYYTDFLRLTVDGTNQDSITGTPGWQQDSVEILSGTHTVRWTYEANYGGFGAYGTAWLDQVTFTPAEPLSIPSDEPADQTTFVGGYVWLSVEPAGTSPHYQWYKGDQPLDGEIYSSLYLYNVTADSAGEYHVVVTNALGSVTSRTATVTVQNNDQKDRIQFSDYEYTVSQSSTVATITVTRENPSTKTVSVHFTTGTGSAIAKQDYTPVAGTLTFKSRQTVKKFSIPLKDDNEGNFANEYIPLFLSAPAGGAVLGYYNYADLVIVCNDATLTKTVSGNGIIADALPGTLRDLGNTYKITAKPASGQLFNGWDGIDSLTDAQRFAPLLKFTMTSNLVITANFVENKFPGVRGTYKGSLVPVDGITLPKANLTITTSSTPAFKGSFVVAGISFPISSSFRPDGTKAIPVKVGKKKYVLSLSLDLDPAGTHQLTANLMDGTTVVATITAPKK
jgi:hypothetical protein